MNGLVVDLFAGAGGWDEGLRQAGYDGPLVGIDNDLTACRTAQAADHERICADVAVYPLEPFVGRVDGLLASPPCQAFSNAGRRLGLADPRGALVGEPLRWAKALLPRWIALEQVPPVSPIWRYVAHELRALGYSAWTGELCAADYGVPQTRVRAYLIARRDGIPAQAPATTHSREAEAGLFGAVRPWVSMAEALGWGLRSEPCPVVMTAHDGGGASNVLRGGSWRAEWWQRQVATGAVLRNGPQANATVRSTDEPAATIYGQRPGNLTWVQDRPSTTVCGDARIGRPGHKDRESGEAQFAEHSVRVSVTEAAILQGFRADYPWQGNKSQQYQQVGNAVCPPVAAAICAPLLAADSRGAAA